MSYRTSLAALFEPVLAEPAHTHAVDARVSQGAFLIVSTLLFLASATITVLWCSSMSAMGATKIVIVTQQLLPDYLRAAFAAGVKAYVAQQSAASELIAAIRLAIANRYYVTPRAGVEAAKIANLHPDQNPAELFGSKLTPRQREVLQLVAEGKSTKEISSALGISTKTVEFHRNCLMDELGLRGIAELTRYAISQGMIST